MQLLYDLPKSEALDSIKCNVFVVSLIGRLLLKVKRSVFLISYIYDKSKSGKQYLDIAKRRL
jgi:hypothetical protein